MTLIIGLMTDDSIVVAAEQEEGCGIAAKRNVDKLKILSGDDWALVVGGAGDGTLIDTATRLINKHLNGRSGLTEDDLSDAIYKSLDEVHTKYVDKDRQSEGVSLVVAASCGPDLHLISTSKRTPHFQDYMAYAGIGSDIGIFFIDKLHHEDAEWKRSVRVAHFVMKQVKESTRFCSGDSQMVVLQTPPSPRWRSLGQPDTDCELDGDINFLVNFEGFINKSIDDLRDFPFEDFENYQDEFHPEPTTDEEVETRRQEWLKAHPKAEDSPAKKKKTSAGK